MEWLTRLRDWFRRDRLGDELAEELRFHQQQLERAAAASGTGPADAVRAARRRLGNLTRAREDARERWSWPWLDRLQQDVGYAFRGLRRSPGFTATVMITLGLGIGANAAMFGIVDRLMFRPFRYLREPEQVRRVYLQINSRGRILTRTEFPYTRASDIQSATTSFSEYARIAERPLAVGVGEGVRERPITGVSGSFFEFFDARPALGRFFGPTEDSIPRGANVAVLGHAFWQAEYAGSNVVGQPIHIGSAVFTIVGVAPEGFVGITDGPAPTAYIPITTFPEAAGENKVNSYYREYNWDWTALIVRRKPGISNEVASGELTEAFIRSRAAQRIINPTWVSADSLAHPRAVAGAVRRAGGPDAGLESKTLLWVTGVAAIVLLIACANVTNLMVARVLRRRREFAMRLALGVSRGRLIGQCFVESLILALLGCLTGILIAQWGGTALGLFVNRQGLGSGWFIDWRTLAVAGGLGIVAALVTAIGPAVMAIRGNLAGTLRAGAREGTYQRSRTRSGLLVVQGALSVMLLVGAGLFVRSLLNVRAMPLGYDADSIVMVVMDNRGLQLDSAATVAFRRRVLAAAQAIPGVQYATRVNSRPFSTSIANLAVPGVDSVARLGRFNFQLGTPDYFKVTGTRILRGRSFNEADREGTALVVVVSETMGRVLWPGQDPIGQCIQVRFTATNSQPTPCTTVIGIAEDVIQQNMINDERLFYYLPLDQVNPTWGQQMFVRVSGETAGGAAVELVRRELQKVMPGPSYVTVSPMGDVIATQRRSWELGAIMFVGFGALALLVAAVGLYGTIGYNVAQRTHELGVRAALGAKSADLVRLVIGQGVRFAVAGIAIGLAVALLAARWIQPLLFEASATDVPTYLAVSVTMLAVAVVASAVPAIRATRADPNAALRSD